MRATPASADASKPEIMGPKVSLHGRRIARADGPCLALSGAMISSCYPALLKVVLELAAALGEHLYLDLAGLEYVDAARCLVEARRVLAAGGQKLTLLAPSPAVRREMESTGLDAALGF